MSRKNGAAKGKAGLPLKKIIDQDLIDALSHPVRGHILAVLNEKIASPTEIGREIGVGATYLDYHFKALEAIDFIELVRTEPRRGVQEHFYRAKPAGKLYLTREDMERLPACLKSRLSGDLLRSIGVELAAALEAGTFDARDDRHLTWMPMLVDPKGWRDSVSVLDRALEQLLAIRDESVERLARTREDPIPVSLAMTCYEAVGAGTPDDSPLVATV